MRIQRYDDARSTLKDIDPNNPQLLALQSPDYVPTEEDIQRIEAATKVAAIKKVCDFYRPNGQPVGQPGTSTRTRLMPGGMAAAQQDYNYLSAGLIPAPIPNGSRVLLPGDSGYITLRPNTSTQGSPAIDINIPGVLSRKLHY